MAIFNSYVSLPEGKPHHILSSYSADGHSCWQSQTRLHGTAGTAGTAGTDVMRARDARATRLAGTHQHMATYPRHSVVEHSGEVY